MAVKQPIGQKRLTNIAVVRIRKNGKRFEVACYKNKVISWRSGVEKDIDEVLQTHTIFSNVGKGSLAKSKELKEAFGTDNEETICREILDKGEFQVSDKEREMQVSGQFRDIASIVMEKTINPETQRPYTMGMIERFIRDVHFSIDPHKSSKQQALELIRDLEKRFPISRARMELRLTVPLTEEDRVNSQISEWKGVIETSGKSETHYWVVCQLDPGKYRESDAFVQKIKGRLEVVSMAVQKEGDSSFEVFDQEQEREGGKVRVREGLEREREISSFFETGLKLSEKGSSSNFSSEFDESAIIVGSIRPNNFDPMETFGISSSLKTDNNSKGSLLGSGRENNNNNNNRGSSGKEQRCSTCQSGFNNTKDYREHFKSEWHKHNLKRKLQNLAPLSAEDCETDLDIVERRNDMDQYS